MSILFSHHQNFPMRDVMFLKQDMSEKIVSQVSIFDANSAKKKTGGKSLASATDSEKNYRFSYSLRRWFVSSDPMRPGWTAITDAANGGWLG